jgi:hypothetical protein
MDYPWDPSDSGDKGHALALLMHLKRCNFRPTGPFGITLRAGCAMDGAVCLIPHCHWPSRTIYGTSRRVASCWAWGSWDCSCSVREIAVERLTFDRSDQQISNQPWSYTPEQLSSTPLRHMGGAGGSYWAICWLFYVHVLFIRHSGPRLYPLTKSFGHQTSFLSCPSTYDAHNNIHWSKRGGASWGFASQTALTYLYLSRR